MWPFDGVENTWGVQGVCVAEGTPYLEQFVVTHYPEETETLNVLDSEGTLKWTLNRCPE
ncbi:MAG: hypothetical protein KDJ77_06525 [Rhodobiaceae bacterium]|nr:hypothetical protein [Rhodobiaceae bacterium]